MSSGAFLLWLIKWKCIYLFNSKVRCLLHGDYVIVFPQPTIPSRHFPVPAFMTFPSFPNVRFLKSLSQEWTQRSIPALFIIHYKETQYRHEFHWRCSTSPDSSTYRVSSCICSSVKESTGASAMPSFWERFRDSSENAVWLTLIANTLQ